MDSKTRIKVNRDQLIEKLRERQSRARTQYETDLAQYTGDLSDWERNARAEYREAMADWLQALSDEVRKGDANPDFLRDRWSEEYKSMPTQRSRPQKPQEPAGLDLAIQQLEIASDEAITITAQDFAAYMGH